MALEIDRQHTALLAMDFENDIVHPEGAFKDFGFAQMVAESGVLDKMAQLLTTARPVKSDTKSNPNPEFEDLVLGRILSRNMPGKMS